MTGQPRIVNRVTECVEPTRQVQCVATELAQADVQTVQVFQDARYARTVEYRAQQHARTGVDVVDSTLSDSYSPSCDLRLSCARMPYVVIV